MFPHHTPSYPVHQLFLLCLLQTLDISCVRGPQPAWLIPRVTKLPEGGISGQTGIFEKVLLFCLQELLVIQLEPVDVDFDALGVSMGFTSNHKRPVPHQLLCLRPTSLIQYRTDLWFLRASMPSENLGDV